MVSLRSSKTPDLVIRSVFNKYDTDRSGWLDLKELRGLFYDLGFLLDAEEVAEIAQELDTDGTNRVEFVELNNWWHKSDKFRDLDPEHLELRRESATYFNYFDRDKTGQLSRTEFSQLWADLMKNGVVTSSLEKALGVLDGNHDGNISFNEFMDFAVHDYQLRSSS